MTATSPPRRPRRRGYHAPLVWLRACPAAMAGAIRAILHWPPSRSTEKSWPHFRPSAVDFCGSRLAIGAATERARALAMPAGTRAQALQTRANSSGVVPVWACFTMVSARLSNSRATLRACVWERELIRARTGEGRKRAKERGVRFGRARQMTPHQRQEALQRLIAGETQADVARTYAVDAATISRLAAASPSEQGAVGDLR